MCLKRNFTQSFIDNVVDFVFWRDRNNCFRLVAVYTKQAAGMLKRSRDDLQFVTSQSTLEWFCRKAAEDWRPLSWRIHSERKPKKKKSNNRLTKYRKNNSEVVSQNPTNKKLFLKRTFSAGMMCDQRRGFCSYPWAPASGGVVQKKRAILGAVTFWLIE